jgi:hypothetical protein
MEVIYDPATTAIRVIGNLLYSSTPPPPLRSHLTLIFAKEEMKQTLISHLKISFPMKEKVLPGPLNL